MKRYLKSCLNQSKPHPNCCTASNTCISCKPPLTLFKGRCLPCKSTAFYDYENSLCRPKKKVEKCRKGYFDGKRCYPCLAGCEKCQDATSCDRCENPSEFDGWGSCFRPSDSYIDTVMDRGDFYRVPDLNEPGELLRKC